MDNTIKVDETTIEKSIHSMIVNLVRSYMVSKKINKEDACDMAAKFLKVISIEALGAKSDVNMMLELLQESVDILIKEYATKKDRSYTGLLKIREMLHELHPNKS